ncbi:MAG: GNAT family N-acetyltransferase [Deinococcales bacterium]
MTVFLPTIPEELRSERLILRGARASDSNSIYQAVRLSLPDLKQWMPWATDDYSLAGCESNLRQAAQKFSDRSDMRFLAFEKSTGQFVVSSGLHPCDNHSSIAWEVPKFEIGYWCVSSYCGRGYVSETVRALSRFAFEHLNAARIQIRCADDNVASARVAENCGFVLEGIHQNDSRNPDGRLCSTRVYALTKLSQLQTSNRLKA